MTRRQREGARAGGGKDARNFTEESSAHTLQTQTGATAQLVAIHAAFSRTFGGAAAHTRRRAGRRKLPFTYRTFGVRRAPAQSRGGQQSGYSQHLHGRDSGKEKGDDVFSLLSSPPFNSLRPPLSSPMRPLVFILSSSRRVRKTVRGYLGPNRQPWKNQPGVRKKQKKSPHRRSARLHGWQLLSAETGPESRAPRDQSEPRHGEEEGPRYLFSSLLPSNYPPIFYLSLALVSSAPTPALSTSHLLSPQPPSPLQSATPRRAAPRRAAPPRTARRAVDGNRRVKRSVSRSRYNLES